MLYNHAQSKRDGNAYWDWIENYVAEDYVQAVDTGSREWDLFTAPPFSTSNLVRGVCEVGFF